jgi:putative membrane protein
MHYPGIDGFLPTRASLMLDVVFLAMFAVLPILGVSIYLVKYRRLYALHKRIQLVLGFVLLAAVALFEIDMRFISGWQERAAESPYYRPIEAPGAILATVYLKVLNRPQVEGWVFTSLAIHLFFAVTTTVLWAAVIVRALRKFPNPPAPCAHSASHMFWARIAAIDMALTALTGWIFYYLAFVA